MQRIRGSRTPHLGPARRSLNALIHGALPEGHGSTRARILPRGRRFFERFVRGAFHGRRCGWVAWPSGSWADQVSRDVCPAELAHAIFECVTHLYELT